MCTLDKGKSHVDFCHLEKHFGISCLALVSRQISSRLFGDLRNRPYIFTFSSGLSVDVVLC